MQEKILASSSASPDARYDMPKIPDYEISRDGHRVNTKGKSWRLTDLAMDSATIHWHRYSNGSVKHAAQLYACYLIRSVASTTVLGALSGLRTAQNSCSEWPISLCEMDRDWWVKLRQNLRERAVECRLSEMRKFYLWLAEKEFPEIDQELAFELNDWSIPSNIKGEAVMARDPNCGPLNAREFAVLTETLAQQQPVTLGLIATYICKELGPNSRNVALLEERDLIVFSDPNEPACKTYQLDIPRIKKRLTRNIRIKNERAVKRRPLSEAAGRAIQHLIDETRRRLGVSDPFRPLLCRSVARTFRADRAGKEDLEWRSHSNNILDYVSEYGELHQLTTSNGPFRITPRRLRYTFGTRLAAENQPAKVIAEAMDHSDTRSVLCYINASHHITTRLFEHLDPKLGPIMDDFMGRIKKPKEGDVIIPGRTHNGALLGGIGLCGSGSLCKLMPGLSCYACPHYYPIENAPHQKMLETAYLFRGKYVSADGSSNSVLEIMDRVILGIRAAIEATQKIKL